MSLVALTCEEMLADFESTVERWRVFFEKNPAALTVPCDVAASKNVGELVWHIYVTSIRHSQRLLGEPVAPFDQGRSAELATLQALAMQAIGNLQRFLEASNEQTLNEIFEYTIRSGAVLRSSRRKLYIHIYVHAVRHWAQIATLLRQHDLKPDWQLDFLMSTAIE